MENVGGGIVYDLKCKFNWLNIYPVSFPCGFSLDISD